MISKIYESALKLDITYSNKMQLLYIFYYLDSYLKTLLLRIFPYTELTLINKSNLNIFRLNFFFIICYYFLFLLSKFNFFEKQINMIFSSYNVVYLFNDRYNLSNNFIIRTNEKKNMHCTNIKSILIRYNNELLQDITNKIRKYDYDFCMIYFFLINKINPKDVRDIILEYIPIFNLSNKEIPLREVMNKKIDYILKN